MAAFQSWRQELVEGLACGSCLMLLCATTGLKGWSPNSIIMDAPRIFHLDKLAIFLVVEGMLIAIGVISYSAWRS